MRTFKKLISMGNSDTLKNVRILHNLLDHALGLISALQQGAHEFDPLTVQSLDQRIREVIVDLWTALGENPTGCPENEESWIEHGGTFNE